MTRRSRLYVNHMPRVVLDTVIFIRALLNPYGFSGRLLFEYLNDYCLVLSSQLIEEILEVLGRKEIIERFHLRQTNLPEAMARLIKSIDSAEIIEINRRTVLLRKIDKIPAISRDPKDDKFLATAKTAHADYLVSADKDLLDLKEYEGVEIIDVETFLQILEERR